MATKKPAGGKPETRRDRGDGSVFPRKGGRRCGVHDVGERPDGTRDRRYVCGKPETEANETLRKLQDDHQRG